MRSRSNWQTAGHLRRRSWEGIKRGDIILAFDGKNIGDSSDLPITVAETPVGKTVEVKVMGDGKQIHLKVTVAELTEVRMTSHMRMPERELGIRVDAIRHRGKRYYELKDTLGVVVTDVVAGSPADTPKIQAGDIIKEVNRKPIKNLKDYNSAREKEETGAPILFPIKRGGKHSIY